MLETMRRWNGRYVEIFYKFICKEKTEMVLITNERRDKGFFLDRRDLN